MSKNIFNLFSTLFCRQNCQKWVKNRRTWTQWVRAVFFSPMNSSWWVDIVNAQVCQNRTKNDRVMAILPKFAKILASITFYRVRHTQQVDSDLACKFEANWTKDEDFVAIFVWKHWTILFLACPYMAITLQLSFIST